MRLCLVGQSHIEEFEIFRGDEYGKYASPKFWNKVMRRLGTFLMDKNKSNP